MSRQLILLHTIFISLSSSTQIGAQTTVGWADLAAFDYTKQMNELMGFKVDLPVFHESVRKLDGREIEISGYIIPVEGYKNQTEFVFSAYPYNLCFFCGNAGPETVMEVYAKKPIRYKAEKLTLRGVLRLNEDDINHLMFRMDDAVLVN